MESKTPHQATGFSAVAEQYLERPLDLNSLLIKHPIGTYFLRAANDFMKDAGIFKDDILIVDRTLLPQNGSIVIAAINQEYVIRYFCVRNHIIILESPHPKTPPLTFLKEDDLEIFGVVTATIHPLQPIQL